MVLYKYVYVYIEFFKGRREERVGSDTLPLTLPWAQKLGEGGKGFLHFKNYFLNGTSWAERPGRSFVCPFSQTLSTFSAQQ